MKQKLLDYLSAHVNCAREDPTQARACLDRCYGVVTFLQEADPAIIDQEIKDAWELSYLYLYELMCDVRWGYQPQ